MAMETVKKAKTPAKSKSAVKAQTGETESAGTAAPAVEEKKAVKSVAASKTADVAAKITPSHAEIARLAERYWAERGWQDGYAEQDWLLAERELRAMAS